MKPLKLFHTIFCLICFVATLYYCATLVEKYLLNESSTQITTKQLDTCQENCHPSYTICLHADNGNILMNIDGITDRKNCYYQMNGEPTVTPISNGIACNSQDLTLPPSSYMDNIVFDYADGSKAKLRLDNISNSYLDPDDQCFTIDTMSDNPAGVGSIIFEFNLTMLQRLINGNLKIFLHHPGQFLKNSFQFRNPVYYIGNFLEINEKVEIIIHIDHIKLSKNRDESTTNPRELGPVFLPSLPANDLSHSS